jgi:hypothetical protein
MKNLLGVVLLMVISITQLNANNEGEKGKKELETYAITGQVIDKLTGEELVGVEITIEDTGKKIYSDFDGTFSLPNLTPGKYTIKAKLVSYQTGKIEEIEILQQENLIVELVRQ